MGAVELRYRLALLTGCEHHWWILLQQLLIRIDRLIDAALAMLADDLKARVRYQGRGQHKKR